MQNIQLWENMSKSLQISLYIHIRKTRSLWEIICSTLLRKSLLHMFTAVLKQDMTHEFAWVNLRIDNFKKRGLVVQYHMSRLDRDYFKVFVCSRILMKSDCEPDIIVLVLLYIFMFFTLYWQYCQLVSQNFNIKEIGLYSVVWAMIVIKL